MRQPNVSSPQRPGVMRCDEQIKGQFADAPNGSLANYHLGWRYLNSKEFDDAAAAFQKAIQSIPEWSLPLRRRDNNSSCHQLFAVRIDKDGDGGGEENQIHTGNKGRVASSCQRKT